jgi:hypothetical protein
MHVRNSGFGCDPSRRGQIGAATTDSVPKFGKNVETVGQHAGRGDASIGTRFGGAPSSTFLGLSRTVGHHARWQDTPAAEEVRGIVAVPVIRILSACPLEWLPLQVVLNTRTIC